MGIGRQVADAYIDVHGDLSKFRRDLQGADAEMRDAARENADAFSDAWGKRVEQDINGKWGSIVDAMYSEKQIDWNRMIGEFDSRNLDDARQKITQFLREMRDTHGFAKDEDGGLIDLGPKFDDAQFNRMVSRLHEVIGAMQKQEAHAQRLVDLQGELARLQDEAFLKDKEDGRIQEAFAKAQENLARAEEEAHKMNAAWMDRRRKTMEQAIEMNKEWARTWDGMRKNNAIKDMGEDFRKLAQAMNSADLGKFAKSFDSLPEARNRIFEVTNAMVQQRRMSQQQADDLHAQFQQFMDDEAAKAKALKDAKDATARLKQVQDDYNKSLSGMARSFHFSELEGQFKKLAEAMDSGDWSHFAKGADDADDMRDSISRVATEMHRLGRMSDQELTLVNTRAGEAAGNFRVLSGEVERQGRIMERESSGGGGSKFLGLLGKLGGATRGLREHLGGFAGLNVFGDLIEGGLEFIHNLDRIALNLAQTGIKFTTFAAVGGQALGSLVTIASDLGVLIGGLAVAAPAFAIGTGISIGVLVSALKDTKTVLKDLKPQFKALQDSISAAFWKEAAGPIRDTVNALMPILQPKLNANASALGEVAGKIAKAFKDIPADKINDMFDRMNRATVILGDAFPPIIQAFTTLGDVGSQYFERFAGWIVDLSNQFNDFIQKSAANGNLNKWVEEMITQFKNLGRIVGDALSIFSSLDDAARRAGFGGLTTLADVLDRIAGIMRTEEFKTTLTTYLSGARDMAQKLGKAIEDLGPAAVSFKDTAKTVFENVGTAVSDLIGYVGDIFKNPTFQQGVKDFTGGLTEAVKHLEPAVKPFSDSIGNALSLLGKVLVSVADIATAFTVVLSPVLDGMSKQLQTLVQPLSDTAINFVKQMKGPLEALDKNIIGPVVEVVKDKLLPAVNRFFEKAGPVIEKIIKDLGPVFVKLVEALPKAIDFLSEVLPLLAGLVEVLAPTVAVTIEKIGDSLQSLADGLKAVHGELPLDLRPTFVTDSPDKVKADAEKIRQQVADNMDPKSQGNVGWGKVLADLMWGAPPDVFWSEVWNMVGPDQAGVDNFQKTFGATAEGIRAKLQHDWDEVWSGRADREFADKMIEWFPEQKDFINGVTGWIDDVFTGKWFGQAKDNIVTLWNDTWKEGGHADKIDKTVNDWLKTNLTDPFGKAVEEAGKAIPDSFKQDVSEWGLGPAIVNWFNNDIAPEIGKGFTEGWKNIAEGRWGSSPEGAKKWEGFWKGWNDFWSAPEGSFTNDINKTVNKWFTDNVFTPLGDAWNDAMKHIGDWLKGDGGGGGGGRGDANGQDLWNKFWGGFEGMFKDAKKGNADISKTVNDWLDTNVWKPIGDWFKNLDWGKIGDDLWNGFIGGVTGKQPKDWEKITQGFQGWVEDMKKFFGIKSPSTLMFDMAGDIVQGFLNGFGEFATKVGEKWEEIKTSLGTKWEEIKTNLSKWIEDRKTDWSNFWTSFGTTISTKWEEFKTTLSTKWTEVKDNLNTWIEDRKRDWSNFWGSFGTTISTKWEEFKKTISTKFEEIKTGINNKITEVKTNWNNFWGGIKQKLEEVWNGIPGFIRDKFGEAKTNIDKKISEIRTNWDNFWKGLPGKIKTTWDDIGKGIDTGIKNAVNWFKGMPERIYVEIRKIDLWALGWTIIKGLWDGMLARWGQVTGWVKSIAEWIKKNKGPIEYDAVLLVPAGKAIMDGLMNGLQSRMDPLLNTLQTITGAVTDAVTADLDKSKMYVAGVDAAQGLADGLKANRSSVHAALGSLTSITVPTQQVTVSGSFAAIPAVGRPTADPTPGRHVTIAEGAIKIETPTKSPDIVAAKVIDSFVNYSSL